MIQEWLQPHDREADAEVVAEGDVDGDCGDCDDRVDCCGGTGSTPPGCQG
jgi:hypothetical protein